MIKIGVKKMSNGKEANINSDIGHLMTFSPANHIYKNSLIVDNLKTYLGAAIIIDSDGKIYNETHRQRSKLGHQVIVVDPFGISSATKLSLFNPLDILSSTKPIVYDEILTLVNLLIKVDYTFTRQKRRSTIFIDPYWEESARSLVYGLLIYICLSEGLIKNDFSFLIETIYSDDVVYNLAKLLDDNKDIDKLAHKHISAFLQKPDTERGSILSTIQQNLMMFGNPMITRAIEKTTFSLDSIRNGDPITIYLIYPLEQMKSHRELLKLWLSSLLLLIYSRQKKQNSSTLLYIEESIQLGNIPMVDFALTSYKDVGLRIWSQWITPEDISSVYSESWMSILSNHSVIQALKPENLLAANFLSDFFKFEVDSIKKMEDDDILTLNGLKDPILLKIPKTTKK